MLVYSYTMREVKNVVHGERSDRMDDSDALIGWEHEDDRYRFDLDGNPDITMELSLLASDTCPYCNNSRTSEITYDVLAGMTIDKLHEKYSIKEAFSRSEMLFHIANHILPIYEPIAMERVAIPLESEYAQVLLSGTKTRQKALVEKTALEPGSRGTSIDADLRKRRAVDDYYYVNGEVRAVKFKRWTRGRMLQEIDKRKEDSLNFLDKMKEYMRKTDEVYDAVMEEGDIRNYGIAIAAVREGRGILESIGKMGLIAKKLGEDTGGIRRMSPEMQAMMAKLGIIKDAQALPDHSSPSVELHRGDSAERIMEVAEQTGREAEMIFRSAGENLNEAPEIIEAVPAKADHSVLHVEIVE